MGINTEWVKIWKQAVPHAFLNNPDQYKTRAGFIDGQIQLMKSKNVVSWDQFVLYQFVMPLKKIFLERKAEIAVLAFDNYEYVPKAKGMTQAKRSKQLPPFEFHEREQLPVVIPEYWDRAIRSRAFKKRVIQLVLERLPSMMRLTESQTLIIDYDGPPTMYGGPQKLIGQEMQGFDPIGESDLKFFRYADLFESLLVVSTDSDYIPITMIRLEQRAQNRVKQPLVVLQRIKVNETPKKIEAQKRTKREIEFVNINILFKGLQGVMQSATSAPRDGNEITRLCNLVALIGGTDFSRPMPLMGPRRAWELLFCTSKPMDLSACINKQNNMLHRDMLLEHLIAKVYASIYRTHVHNERGFDSVMAQLQASRLSEKTKNSLPTREFVEVSTLNAKWTVLYWGGVIMDETDFGYKYKGSRMIYADQ